MILDRNLTAWFVETLAGGLNVPIGWRCIHDTNRALPGHNYYGTLDEVYPTLKEYNEKGYGIFCNINATDGRGHELSNISYIRAHVADLDDPVTAQASYDRAVTAGASFAVQSSPGKYHIYWRMQPYTGNEFFTLTQRKLAQFYGADKTIIDATRVMRVPGFLHLKSEPFLVTGWPLANINHVRTFEEIQKELEHVNVFESMSTRKKLGTEEMQAPSLEWLQYAMSFLDPNELDRSEWLSISAAIKQAGWNHTTPEELERMWLQWCAQYKDNDEGENLKLWNSIQDTETGWKTLQYKTPVKAYMMFGHKQPPPPETATTPTAALHGPEDVIKKHDFGEILSQYECQELFKNCYFVERTGQIITDSGRFMNATQFNGKYGGKHFIVTSTGKTTDEPWKAALRSTCWTIPKVDHIRFLPDRPTFEIIEDALGRRGLNTYIPARIDARPGDVSIWLDHVTRILPNENDRHVFFEYLAHAVKFPGYKIPWAPLLQSAEGIGKTVFFEVMQHALGDMYVYSPKAPELVKSGSTFNAWMRGKLLIVVNEIKIDERRELIEILKPMITDNRVEIQSKGVDQEMEDNPANWLFFSNYKDAIPINQNGRRYSIFYSALQSRADILNAGMDKEYFDRLWRWLREQGGLQFITHWLLNYPVERGGIAVTAPETSSHDEALRISRSPMEVIIAECISDGICGFRGGYVSTIAVAQRCKAAGMRTPNTRTVQTCLESMGYVPLGRAVRAYMQEDINSRTELYGLLSGLPVAGYGEAQGYE